MPHGRRSPSTSTARAGWWPVPLWVAGVATLLGVLALQPWDPSAGGAGRSTWVTTQQAALVVLAVLAWQAPDLTGVGDRVLARAGVLGIVAQLALSIWNNQVDRSYQWDGSQVDDVVLATLTASTGVAAVTAFAAIARRRSGTAGHDVAATVDTLVVSTALGVVVWESLAARMDATGMTVVAIAMATVIVVASTAVAVRLLLSPARRTGAAALLAMALGCCAVGVPRFGLDAMAARPPRDPWWELALLLALALFVAALLHPSMAALLDGDDGRVPGTARAAVVPEGTVRAAVLCVATVVPATVVLVRALSAVGGPSGPAPQTALTVPSAAASVVITIGVAWRLALLVRDREQAQALLEHGSRHDHLTGLPNRAHLLERLEREVRRVQQAEDDPAPGFGLMFLDLDGFKAINDHYGHHAGDAVLVAVAQRLADVVRTDDLVARTAGDEFVLLCADPADEPSLAQLADRVRAAIETPLPADFGVVTPEVSIGIAAVDRVLATSAGAVSAILRRADDEMDAAKRVARAARAAPPPDRAPRSTGEPQPYAGSDVDRVG